MASPTIQTLTSFSGADLVATFANKVIGELQQISWAVQRDKAPVFTCGSPDARSFSRGKRGIAGSMVFAVFDHDALVSALQTVWQDIAPAAMFTAAGNNKKAMNEDFSNALDMMKWNATTSNLQNGVSDDYGTGVSLEGRGGYGFSFGSTAAGDYTDPISAQQAKGSNSKPIDTDGDGFIDKWDNNDESVANIYVPAGFSPIRGENVIYADTLPPFDITLTFASEYGHTAFQKIYDVDILNESSGASVDTVVMARQVTWIARRMSPLIRGVYDRTDAGDIRGIMPTAAAQDGN
jgi:hypothetical protein